MTLPTMTPTATIDSIYRRDEIVLPLTTVFEPPNNCLTAAFSLDSDASNYDTPPAWRDWEQTSSSCYPSSFSELQGSWNCKYKPPTRCEHAAVHVNILADLSFPRVLSGRLSFGIRYRTVAKLVYECRADHTSLVLSQLLHHHGLVFGRQGISVLSLLG